MENSILAKDIMTPKPICMESSTAIPEAILLFTEKKISSVPVMTTMGEVAGQLTELVMMRIFVLHQLQPDKFKRLNDCLEMLEPARFVAPTDTMTTVIKAIMGSESRRILVKSDGRQILGIISPKDLLRQLIEGKEGAKTIQSAIQKDQDEQNEAKGRKQ